MLLQQRFDICLKIILKVKSEIFHIIPQVSTERRTPDAMSALVKSPLSMCFKQQRQWAL